MASSIKVALQLDDSNYRKKLSDAENASKSFGATLAQAGAQGSQAFDRLGSAAESLQSKMASVAGAIAGIGMAAYIQSALQAASTTKDLSEAYGVTVASILELQAGFAKAGKSPEDLMRAMETLAGSMEQLKDGNPATIASFNALGLTFDDVKNKKLDEQLVLVLKAAQAAGTGTEALTARTDLLGRSMKGVPIDDLIGGLDKAKGKQDALASATESLDATQKLLEQSVKNVKNEFMQLIQPIADAFNAFVAGSDNSKLAAGALVAAMGAFTAGGIVVGINAVVQAFRGLTGAVGLSAVATAAEAVAFNANTASMVLNIRIKTAATAARAASLEASLAEAAAVIAGTSASMSEAAAKKIVELQTWRLNVARAASAGETAALAVAERALATAYGASAVGANVATVATSALAARLALLAPYAVAAAAALALLYSPDLNQGEEEQLKKIRKLGDALQSLTDDQKKRYFALSAADKKRVDDMLVSSSEAKKAQDVLNGIMGNQTTPGTPSGGGDVQKNQNAANEYSLRRQGELQQLMNRLSIEKLNLTAKLITASDEEKARAGAAFEARSKQQQEEFRLTTDIQKLRLQIANEPQGDIKYAGQLKILEAQLATVKKQKDETAGLTQEIARQTDLYKMQQYFTELQAKSKQSVADIDRQIADLSRSEDERKLAALQQQIKVEQEAAVKRRQDQLGATPIASGERADIEERVRKAMEGQVEAQRLLSAAERAAQERQFQSDIKNKSIEDQIRLEGELTKLTQTADQQKITDLKTQLELQIRQEIVRRQSTLAPGQELNGDEQVRIREQITEANQGVIDSQMILIDQSRQFATGWKSALAEYVDNAANASNTAREMFSSAMGSMNSALDKFVETGKLNFGDLARSIIMDLLKIQLRKAAAGFVGSLFGFANGGEPPVGEASIVGERGPELFVPKVKGTIIPNNKISGMMSGGTGVGGGVVNNYTYNNSVTAMDAKSVAQLFYDNRHTMFGTVEAAKKEMPMRR
jgi:lambda family phage tail tape measure protein